MKRTLGFASAILSLISSAACWASVSISVSPGTVQVLPGGRTQFTATVGGTTNSVVIWSLAGTNCSGIACGQITSGGIYSAPATAPNPNVVTVTATSLADLSVSASAAVIVGTSSDVKVSVSPATATVLEGQQQKFVAFVSGTTITGVRWSLSGASCGSSGCGTIGSDGTFTAPANPSKSFGVTVQATSIADPTRAGTAAVTVALPVAVAISPASASVTAAKQQQFGATVTNSSNTAVSWSVTGSGCKGAACGTISSGGLYTAPASPPNPAQVFVTATANADPTKSATASVTILAPVGVTLSPTSATVLTGGHQQFTASVQNASNTSVTWSLVGSGCSGSACGTITTGGLYTAPSAAPKPNQVTVTATSVADPSKSAQALVTINAPVSIKVSPSSAEVVLGATQQFTAAVSGSSNQSVSWTLAGSGCSGASCGVISASGIYTAPIAMPNPAQIFVTATAAADPTKSSTATVTVIQPVVVTISPTSASVVAGAHQQFLATVTGTGNTSVTWSVAGSGCTGTACGTVSSSGLYTAPSTPPSPSQVKVTVTSTADPSRSATATVTIVPPVAVTISPTTASVPAGEHQQFGATVTGTTNTAVTWSVSGTGCSGSACGVVSSTGLFSAPGKVPSPAQVTVKATSAADPSKSASATVTILPAVVVTVSPSLAQVVVKNQEQFKATVTGTQNTAVTWSVKGSGCSGTACGTVSSTGLYTAPAAVPSPAIVTITAVSQADPTKSASASISVIPPVLVTVSPQSAVVAVNHRQQFAVKVNGSSNSLVTWSVSGAGCSGAACGTISSGGLYTAPGAVPNPATVIIKASSDIDVSQSASATVTLVANPEARLQGAYAFRFTGFDSGAVYESVGSFTADGDGRITSGLEDINSIAGPATAVPFTGTYSIGSDNRGSLTFSTTTGTQIFSFALNATDTAGRFIELDTTGIRGSGSFERQNASDFATAAVKGPYAVSLTGQDSAGRRIGALAVLYLNGQGAIPTGTMDVNDGGTVAPTFGSLNGSYRIDSSGRGTISLSVPGFDGGAFRFAFYVVSAEKLMLVSTDSLSSDNPILGGLVELQSGIPYLTASFAGPAVFSLSGEDNHTSQVTVGRIVFDGVSQPLVQFDQNTGGTVTTDNILTGAYSVSVNGSGTINLDDSNGHERIWYLCAIAPDHAFLMDASSPAVGMGELIPQTARMPFVNGDILGTYLLGSGEPLLSGATLLSGYTAFDGKSSVSGTEDASQASSLVRGRSLTGTYSVSGPANDGRGTLIIPAEKETFALWVGSNSEVLGLDLDPSTSEPVVLYFEQ